MHLLYRYNVPAATTSIVDVIQSAIFDLEHSAASYKFSQGPSGSAILHELFPLQLLCFHDRGRIRPSDRSIRLREEPASRSLMLQDMVSNLQLFAPRTVQGSIENNRFVIHLSKYCFITPICCINSLSYIVVRRSPLIGRQLTSSGTGDGRMHSCIAKKMYNRFPTDDPDGVLAPGPLGFDDDTCSETSGAGDSNSGGDTDIEMEDALPPVLVVSAASTCIYIKVCYLFISLRIALQVFSNTQLLEYYLVAFGILLGLPILALHQITTRWRNFRQIF